MGDVLGVLLCADAYLGVYSGFKLVIYIQLAQMVTEYLEVTRSCGLTECLD